VFVLFYLVTLDAHRILVLTIVIAGWVVKNVVLAFTSGWVGGGGDELLGEAWLAYNIPQFLIYFVDMDSVVASSFFKSNRRRVSKQRPGNFT
jgi:hypothetical protein